MKFTPSIKKNLVPVLIGTLLWGCGGGGSETPSTPTNQTPSVTVDGDSTIEEGQLLSLNANASDTDGTITNISWTVTTGENITLISADSENVSFTAPNVDTDTVVTLNVIVTDNDGATASQSTSITITSSQENQASLTITGLVIDEIISNAEIKVLIGDNEFSETADENGVYSIAISVDESLVNQLVQIQAIGDSNINPEVEFVSQLGSLASLIQQAGEDNNLTINENFGVNVTNVTTAEYALISRDGVTPTNDTELNAAINALNSVEKNTLAALIKIAVDDESHELPSGISTLNLVNDSATATTFEQEIIAQNPILIAETISSIVNDNSLTYESAIVGSWKIGTDILTFMRSGHYMHITTEVEVGDEECGQLGYEVGTYTWNSATGVLSVTTTEDTGGCGGLHDSGPLNTLDIKEITLSVTGDTLTIQEGNDEAFSAPRLVSDSNPLVGGFYLENTNFSDDLSMAFTLDDTKRVVVFSFDKTQLPEGISYLYITYDYSYDAVSSERLLQSRTIYVNGEITQERPEYLSNEAVNIRGDVISFTNENGTIFGKNSHTTTNQEYLNDNDFIGDFSGVLKINDTLNFEFNYTFNADGTGQSSSTEGETSIEWKVVYGQLLITFEGDGDSLVWSPTNLTNDVWQYNVIAYNGEGIPDGNYDGNLSKGE